MRFGQGPGSFWSRWEILEVRAFLELTFLSRYVVRIPCIMYVYIYNIVSIHQYASNVVLRSQQENSTFGINHGSFSPFRHYSEHNRGNVSHPDKVTSIELVPISLIKLL